MKSVYFKLMPVAFLIASCGFVDFDSGSVKKIDLDKADSASANKVWKIDLTQKKLSSGAALGVTDWTGDGAADLILLAADLLDNSVTVYSPKGTEITTVPLPSTVEDVNNLGMGFSASKIGISCSANSDKSLVVVGKNGNTLWTQQETDIETAEWFKDDAGADCLFVKSQIQGGERFSIYDASGKLLTRKQFVHGNRSGGPALFGACIIEGNGQTPTKVLGSIGTGFIFYDLTARQIAAIRGPADGTEFYFGAANMRGGLQILCQTIEFLWVPDETARVTTALDADGKQLWKCATKASKDLWPEQKYRHGDLDNNGLEDWVFLKSPQELAVITDANEPFVVPLDRPVKDYCILPRPGSCNLLCVLDDLSITTYELPPDGRQGPQR